MKRLPNFFLNILNNSLLYAGIYSGPEPSVVGAFSEISMKVPKNRQKICDGETGAPSV